MNTNIMNTQILKVTKGHFYVYFNLNLRSYGQLFVLVFHLFHINIIGYLLFGTQIADFRVSKNKLYTGWSKKKFMM